MKIHNEMIDDGATAREGGYVDAAPPDRSVSQAMEDYIKVIYKLQRDGQRVSTTDIARAMRTSPASVTKMSKHLAEHKLLTYEPYYGVYLTPIGEKIALETIRHHRLIELYLCESLGYTWDQVDAEAERLEHHISEEFEERIDRLLGRPQTDPHGDPIPTRDGTVASTGGIRLSQAQSGERLTVVRVSDSIPEALRTLTRLGIRLGAQIVVRIDRLPDAKSQQTTMEMDVDGTACQLDRDIAARVFVALS